MLSSVLQQKAQLSEVLKELDFTQKWEMSDVQLKTEDSDNLLHANKTILAVHSPYFRALFFSEFVEAAQDIVAISIPYEMMLEILKIIHHIGRNFGNLTNKLYTAKQLAQLYKLADAFDIPLVRELCRQQFVQIPAKDIFEVSIGLELHQEKSAILKKMTFSEIEVYLKKGITDLVFSPVDVVVIVEKYKEFVEKKRIRCRNCGSFQWNTDGCSDEWARWLDLTNDFVYSLKVNFHLFHIPAIIK